MTRLAGFFLAIALGQAAAKPVQVVVMDPLALPLSCSCVDGVGQRQYDRLADYLGKGSAGGATKTNTSIGFLEANLSLYHAFTQSGHSSG